MRSGWTTLLFVASRGLWLGIYAPVQVLLTEQAAMFDTANKTVVLSVVMGVGAAAALVLGTVICGITSNAAARKPHSPCPAA